MQAKPTYSDKRQKSGYLCCKGCQGMWPSEAVRYQWHSIPWSGGGYIDGFAFVNTHQVIHLYDSCTFLYDRYTSVEVLIQTGELSDARLQVCDLIHSHCSEWSMNWEFSMEVPGGYMRTSFSKVAPGPKWKRGMAPRKYCYWLLYSKQSSRDCKEHGREENQKRESSWRNKVLESWEKPCEVMISSFLSSNIGRQWE